MSRATSSLIMPICPADSREGRWREFIVCQEGPLLEKAPNRLDQRRSQGAQPIIASIRGTCFAQKAKSEVGRRVPKATHNAGWFLDFSRPTRDNEESLVTTVSQSASGPNRNCSSQRKNPVFVHTQTDEPRNRIAAARGLNCASSTSTYFF